MTRAGCHKVLAVVHTVTSGQRLLEAVELVEQDPRVQVVFTKAPDVFGNGVEDFLRATEGITLPWQQAVREEFDLAIAASCGALHELHAPLLLMPHGAGYGKAYPTGIVYGLDAQRLLHNGRVLPRSLVLSHRDQLGVLRGQCPQAAEVAVVAGDPCYDRLVASEHLREVYREALGVRSGQKLVLATSTWGSTSLFGRDLLPHLLDALPGADHRIAALVHPAVWFGHGPRQIRAWLADCLDAGLLLIGPEADWRAAVIAADHVIGDHGSVTTYAAATGRAVLLVGDAGQTAPNSAQAVLARRGQHLDLARPLAGQLAAAREQTPAVRRAVSRALTSKPGRSAALLRQEIYRLLEITEPGRHRATPTVGIPHRIAR
ncbi:hypothetical protein GCM10010174_42400 [Kutzneria viridogrisea]|uniref:UDP-N-acetylglucosamine:LPS N-acetylglucosamine transferase n=1 Tax=Kutzneria viridogrisea TaxID=47990 RepID=A0ABR6BVK8_9PSEU|nr:hypothetical protein [Kutzneria albida]MBA8930932.1 hypothetical protein [Kutzneria viridogrisea]